MRISFKYCHDFPLYMNLKGVTDKAYGFAVRCRTDEKEEEALKAHGCAQDDAAQTANSTSKASAKAQL